MRAFCTMQSEKDTHILHANVKAESQTAQEAEQPVTHLPHADIHRWAALVPVAPDVCAHHEPGLGAQPRLGESDGRGRLAGVLGRVQNGHAEGSFRLPLDSELPALAGVDGRLSNDHLAKRGGVCEMTALD
jgi:hypothetical protein